MYRVVRSTIVRASGKRYEPGDVIEPTDAELRAFGDNLEAVKDHDKAVTHTVTPVQEQEERDVTEICGTEMSDGTTCERLADECPYHGTN